MMLLNTPFLFHVKVSLSFCPSISMSRRIGTSSSNWLLFSCTPAGSVSSKLIKNLKKFYIGLLIHYFKLLLPEGKCSDFLWTQSIPIDACCLRNCIQVRTIRNSWYPWNGFLSFRVSVVLRKLLCIEILEISMKFLLRKKWFNGLNRHSSVLLFSAFNNIFNF
jgi:hypothetical protein